MNGYEIERLLSLIDESVDASRRSLHADLFSYLRDHEEEALCSLRSAGEMRVPTSVGPVVFRTQDLEALVA